MLVIRVIGTILLLKQFRESVLGPIYTNYFLFYCEAIWDAGELSIVKLKLKVLSNGCSVFFEDLGNELKTIGMNGEVKVHWEECGDCEFEIKLS